MSKTLSAREAAVLRILLANQTYGSNGTDLVHGLRDAGEGGVTGVPLAGVHRTAASLCRKDLAWRAGTTKMQFYKITQTGRDVLDGRPAAWRLPAEGAVSTQTDQEAFERDEEMFGPQDADLEPGYDGYLDAIRAAQAGTCSHGGHGWDGDTCDEIPDPPAPA